MASKVRTGFLLLSDTHAALPHGSNVENVAYRYPLPEVDVVLHTGDLTMTGKIEEHESAIRLLSSLNAPLKVVIPGNHDLTLDRAYYATRGHLWGPRPKYTDTQLDDIRKMYTNEEAVTNGIHYLEEGTQTFNLANGAILTIFASAYTPEFCDWAFAYPRAEDRYNRIDTASRMPTFQGHLGAETEAEAAAKAEISHNRNVDVVMTHGPPQTILDTTPRGEQVGCAHLLTGVSRTRPLLHSFGHIHEGWGAILKQWPTTTAANNQKTSELTKQDSNSTFDSFQHHQSIQDDIIHKWTQPTTRDSTEQRLNINESKALQDRAVVIDATNLRRGQETLFVNASIMSLEYKPVQSPWVVDLMLDKKTENSMN